MDTNKIDIGRRLQIPMVEYMTNPADCKRWNDKIDERGKKLENEGKLVAEQGDAEKKPDKRSEFIDHENVINEELRLLRSAKKKVETRKRELSGEDETAAMNHKFTKPKW
jgi:hypothetical protein